MKKLYSNINDINIKGDPSKLYEVVTQLDKNIEKLTNETSSIKKVLFKYLGSNAGVQYQKATKSVHDLSIKLYDFSEGMNDLQIQICKYVEKVSKFDSRKVTGISPRKLAIEKVSVPTSISVVKYKIEEMKQILKSLKNYVNQGKIICKAINTAKLNIGDVWKDRQYKDFATQLDDLLKKTNSSFTILEEYNRYLEEAIKQVE